MARVKKDAEAVQTEQEAALAAPEAAGGVVTTAAEEAAQTAPEGPQDAPEAAGGTDTAAGAEAAQNEPQGPQDAPEVVKLVYVGPSLPRGRLKSNTIFEGTRDQILASAELAEVLKRYPLVKNMLVPVSKLAEAKQKIRTAGNALHKFYADIDSLAAAEGMEG